MIWDGTNDLFSARSTNKFNTFIGFEAGLNSATAAATAGGADGTANTAVGYQSQRAATTSSKYNTSIGTHALNAITTGYGNTGLGANTGLLLTTGYQNVAIGHDAMGNSGIALTGCVAIGVNAYKNAGELHGTVQHGPRICCRYGGHFGRLKRVAWPRCRFDTDDRRTEHLHGCLCRAIG
jgi:hypothetical protein